MAGRNHQRRKTQQRKDRQAETRRVQLLRERAMQFEGMSANRVVRMSTEELERVISSNLRYRMVSHFDGIALALAAASVAVNRRRNRCTLLPSKIIDQAPAV